MERAIKTVCVYLLILLYSCSSKNDVIGIYKNKKYPSASINIRKDGFYEYADNGKIFNTGKWQYKDEGWIMIDFYDWRDLPDFNLIGCKKYCYARIIYDSGELMFKSDNHLLSFKKE